MMVVVLIADGDDDGDDGDDGGGGGTDGGDGGDGDGGGDDDDDTVGDDDGDGGDAHDYDDDGGDDGDELLMLFYCSHVFNISSLSCNMSCSVHLQLFVLLLSVVHCLWVYSYISSSAFFLLLFLSVSPIVL